MRRGGGRGDDLINGTNRTNCTQDNHMANRMFLGIPYGLIAEEVAHTSRILVSQHVAIYFVLLQLWRKRVDDEKAR